MKLHAFAPLGLVYLGLLIGCTNASVMNESTKDAVSTQEVTDALAQVRSSQSYVLQPGDLVDIRVYMEDDMNRVLRISGNGTVTFPLVGNIKIAGLSLEQAEQNLADRLTAYIRQPQVSMLVKEYGNKTVYVLGQVAKPGSIQIPPISTVVLVQDKADLPIDVVAALIWEKDKFLICQRPANKARGMLWEFVGGKVESGETFPQALQRECAEELAITVDVGKQFMQVIHEYPDILIRLTLFHCTIPTGYPQALEHNDIRWIHPSQIDDYQFCPADEDILKRIKQVYGNTEPL